MINTDGFSHILWWFIKWVIMPVAAFLIGFFLLRAAGNAWALTTWFRVREVAFEQEQDLISGPGPGDPPETPAQQAARDTRNRDIAADNRQVRQRNRAVSLNFAKWHIYVLIAPLFYLIWMTFVGIGLWNMGWLFTTIYIMLYLVTVALAVLSFVIPARVSFIRFEIVNGWLLFWLAVIASIILLILVNMGPAETQTDDGNTVPGQTRCSVVLENYQDAVQAYDNALTRRDATPAGSQTRAQRETEVRTAATDLETATDQINGHTRSGDPVSNARTDCLPKDPPNAKISALYPKNVDYGRTVIFTASNVHDGYGTRHGVSVEIDVEDPKKQSGNIVLKYSAKTNEYTAKYTYSEYGKHRYNAYVLTPWDGPYGNTTSSFYTRDLVHKSDR